MVTSIGWRRLFWPEASDGQRKLHQPFDTDDRLTFALTVMEGLAGYARAERLAEADELRAEILVLSLDNRFCSYRAD